MALAAGGGQAGESNRAAVARVAFGATANRAVVVRLANGVALFATRSDCWMPLRNRKWVGWTLRSPGLELLAEGNLLRTQSRFAMHGRPTGRGVTAAQKLLIDAFVTGAAVACRQVSTDHEAVVIHLLLAGAGFVTVQAIHAFLRMYGHLVFVNDGVLKPGMALGTLAGRANEVCGRLVGLYLGAGSIDKEGGKYESKRNDDGHKHRTKRHGHAPWGELDV